MTIHSTFWYLLGPVLRASQLFSYLTSSYNLPGGDDALTVDRGGKETLGCKVTGHLARKGQSWDLPI